MCVRVRNILEAANIADVCSPGQVVAWALHGRFQMLPYIVVVTVVDVVSYLDNTMQLNTQLLIQLSSGSYSHGDTGRTVCLYIYIKCSDRPTILGCYSPSCSRC